MASTPCEELLSFDDVVVVPSKAPVDPMLVDTSSKVSRNVEVSIPVVSSPMDTVTEWRLAAALARLGAVGVIHRNMSTAEQAEQVAKVKASDPSPWAEVPSLSWEADLRATLKSLEEGEAPVALVLNSSGLPVGIVAVLKPFADYGFWVNKAKAVATLVGELKVKPTTDEDGRLRVGAAVGPADLERAKALDKAGADVLVFDVAHFHSATAISAAAKIAKEVSADLVVGNLGTKEGVLEALSSVEKVDGLRVGLSSGSICKTSEVAGAGVPTLSAVLSARDALEELGLLGKVPIIADGGIRGPGSAVKSFVAGASAVMVGRLFASTEEAPSAKVRIGGKLYKTYRGMGSFGAMERRFAADRYSRPSKLVEEGVEGLVEYGGSAAEVLLELALGIKAGLGYAGCARLADAWKAKLARITEAGKKELGPHGVVL